MSPCDAREEISMISFDLDQTIGRPVAAVFAFLNDASTASQWQPAVVDQRVTSEGPVGVGTTGINIRQVMGQRVESTWRVTAHTPDRGFTVQSTSGPVSYQLTYTLTPSASGTLLQLHFEGEPKGFFKVAEPLLAGAIKKDYTDDLGRLKGVLESQA
jgi:uncharacterized protein YndB with AHSA1/START domain